ncbi:hypothetical protein V6N13_105013 [Hibiscus sabdariffa]
MFKIQTGIGSTKYNSYRYNKACFGTKRPGSILVQLYRYSMPYSDSSSQRPYRYGPTRIGTVCLIQIPVAKDRIGTGQAYRYGMPELHTLV